MESSSKFPAQVAILLSIQVLLVVLFGVYTEYDEDANAGAAKNNIGGGHGDSTPIQRYYPMSQGALICVFAATSQYQAEADASDIHNSVLPVLGGFDPEKNSVGKFRAVFQDVHVMIFIGFGFLMTFLKKYGYGAVGFNMMIAAICIQWATLCQGFFHMEGGKILIGITNILNADLATAAVLISFGAVIGKTSPLQLLIMAVVEIALFATNEWVGTHIFNAIDAGASMYVHVFGAYFGLMVSRMLHRADGESSNEGSVYHSDIFAMIGTVFLWIFWPSFNAALLPGDDQHRAVINTYFSLASCCVTAFAISSLLSKENKFDMVHIQNATLAGGVAIGTAADLMVHPYGALLIGMIAGILSVIGYRYIQPAFNNKLKIHDTCGVNNLHGMPGIMAGIIGVIMAAIASETDYGYSLYLQYPARAPLFNSSDLREIQSSLSSVQPGDGRSAGLQAAYQLLALVVTLCISITGGFITGFIVRQPITGKVPHESLFDDRHLWSVPEQELHIPATPIYTVRKEEDTKI